MAGTDMIKTPPLGPRGETWHPWSDAMWPPPQRMLWVQGKATGQTAFILRESRDDVDADFHDSFVVVELELVSASQLPEPGRVEDNFFRGAEYQLVVSAERTLSEHGH